MSDGWMPVATGPAMEIEKVGRNGKSSTELDSDTPLKAAAIVLGAVAHRIKLLAACRPENTGGKDGAGATNVLLWLQSVLPGVQKVVQQVDGANGKRERLVPGIRTNPIFNSNGSIR